jgi:rhodanese-related sulfurtransferase
MFKPFTAALFASALALSASAYDAQQAKVLDNVYSKFTQTACANSKLFISAEDALQMLRDNKPFLFLDIRTDGEAAVIALSGDNSKHIPLQSLFKPESLDQLPTDRPIIVVCHSGVRATMGAMGLKQAGYKAVHVLKGGMVALADANTPKNAPLK